MVGGWWLELELSSDLVNIFKLQIQNDWLTFDCIISGARYSGVPQRVQVRSVIFLAKPKSVIMRCPSWLVLYYKSAVTTFKRKVRRWLTSVMSKIKIQKFPDRSEGFQAWDLCRWLRESEGTPGRRRSLQRRTGPRWRRTCRTVGGDWRAPRRRCRGTTCRDSGSPCGSTAARQWRDAAPLCRQNYQMREKIFFYFILLKCSVQSASWLMSVESP